MPTAHIISFKPIDYRVRDSLYFAASFAAYGYRVRTLELDGYDNRSCFFRDRGMERRLLPFGREQMSLPLHLIRRIMRYIYFIVLALVLRLRYRKGDIVVPMDGWSVFLCSLAVRLENTVYFEQEIPNHENPRTPFFERYLRGFLQRNVRRCAFIITVERMRLRFLSKLYRNPRAVLVLNAAARDEITPRPRAAPTSPKPRILYAGRLWTYTLAPLLLQFVRTHHHLYHFDIFSTPEAGEASRAEYEAIRTLPNVTCHGFAPRSELEAAMEKADVSLVLWDPVGRSNFGLRYCAPHKFFEAVARGIPVLCSPNPPLKEKLGDYKVGELIEPLTVEGMAEALERLFDPAAYPRYSAECIRAFEEKWNFEAQIAPFMARLAKVPQFAKPKPPMADNPLA